ANPGALRAKAYAELQIGDYQDAYADAKSASQREPLNGLGYLYMALAEEKLGKTSDALKHLEQAAQLDAALSPLAIDARSRMSRADRADSPPVKDLDASFSVMRKAGLAVSAAGVVICILFGTGLAHDFGRAVGGLF